MNWIACKDRMPKEYEAVIVVIANNSNRMASCIAFSWWAKVEHAGKNQVRWFFDTTDESCSAEEITHWMPLPEPPKPQP